MTQRQQEVSVCNLRIDDFPRVDDQLRLAKPAPCLRAIGLALRNLISCEERSLRQNDRAEYDALPAGTGKVHLKSR